MAEFPIFNDNGNMKSITGVRFGKCDTPLKCSHDGCVNTSTIGLDIHQPHLCNEHSYDDTIYAILRYIQGTSDELGCYETCMYIDTLTVEETVNLYFTKSVFIMLPTVCEGITKQEVNIIVMDKCIELGYDYLRDSLYESSKRVRDVMTFRQLDEDPFYTHEDAWKKAGIIYTTGKSIDNAHVYISESMRIELRKIATHNDIEKYIILHKKIMGKMVIKDIPNKGYGADDLIEMYGDFMTSDIYSAFRYNLINHGYFEETYIHDRLGIMTV